MLILTRFFVNGGHAAPTPARAATTSGVVGDGTPASCTETALRSAIAGGGLVTFNCGGNVTIAVGEKILIGADTTIDGADKIAIDGELHTRIFEVNAGSTFTVTHLTLMRALTMFSDGGAICNRGHLVVNDVRFVNNSISPDWSGAAIYTSGPAVIFGSVFQRNDAGSGGAIYADTAGARVTLSHSWLLENKGISPASGFGGALRVGTGAEVLLLDSSFNTNEANLGGAIYVARGGKLTVQATNFLTNISENTARMSGGGIYSEGTLIVQGMLFRRNTTPTAGSLSNYGGGIASLGTLTMTESFFQHNESRYGGAVFTGGTLGAGSAYIDGSAFSDNKAVMMGGGLYTNITTNTVTINRSSFNDNSAQSGGGIARINAGLTITNSSLIGNQATQGGGGLFVGVVPDAVTPGFVKVHNTTLYGNRSADERGGGVLNGGRVELYHTTMVSNTQGLNRTNSGNTRLRATVLHNPGYLNCDGDGTNLIADDADNFSTDSSCDLSGNSRQGVGLDPMLGPVSVDSFQTTWYVMPLPGSPLLNQAENCSPLDQRGASRPDACDIGAVEFGGLLPAAFVPLLMK